MFKKPVQLDLNAQDITVNHRVFVAPSTLRLASQKIAEVGITVVVTTTAVLTVKAATDILVHIAKTKIK